MKKSIFILRIILFLPLFLISFSLLNLLLSPVLSFIFGIIDFITGFLYKMDQESTLYRLIKDSIINKTIVTGSSLYIGNYVYPGNNNRVPVIINSSILLIIYTFIFYYNFYSISFFREYLGNNDFNLLMKDISIPNIISEILGSLVRIGFSIYHSFNE